MARRDLRKGPKVNLEVKRLLRLTVKMDAEIKAAADAAGIPVMHWIRQALAEKLAKGGK